MHPHVNAEFELLSQNYRKRIAAWLNSYQYHFPREYLRCAGALHWLFQKQQFFGNFFKHGTCCTLFCRGANPFWKPQEENLPTGSLENSNPLLVNKSYFMPCCQPWNWNIRLYIWNPLFSSLFPTQSFIPVTAVWFAILQLPLWLQTFAL